jgi:hypothetical protein
MLRSNVLLIALLSGSLAFASGKDNEPSSESRAGDTVREFAVPVPQSEIKLEPMRYVPPPPIEFSFGASTYMPNNFTRASYTGAVSRFDRTDLPSLSINRHQNFFEAANGFTIGSEYGLTYLQLSRSVGRVIFNSDAGISTESVNFYMVRAGLEAGWRHLLPYNFEPNLTFALLPTWMAGNRSQFEDSVGVFGLPYEASVGILWRAPQGQSHFGNMTIGISGTQLSGNIGGSSLSGLGLSGELRVSL